MAGEGLGQELASLDFGRLIGGPLNAIVDAQGRAAVSTAKFIQDVGFDKDGAVRNTTFSYSRPNDDGVQEEFRLTVPFISMLPIPYIKIEEGEVEFNAKLTSMQQKDDSSTFEAGGEVGGSVNYWFVRASFKASTSYKKTSSSTEKVERTYDMRVRVLVRGSDLPSGTERLLNILENSLAEKPTGNIVVDATITDDAAKAATIKLSIETKDKDQVIIGDATYTIAAGVAANAPATITPALAADVKADTPVRIRRKKT